MIDLGRWALAQVKALGYDFPQDAAKVATSVRQLSDGYQAASRQTPWHDPQLRAAYLLYFFVLNYFRMRRVLSQLPPGFWDDIEHIVEIGSGAGNFHAALAGWGGPMALLANYEVLESSNEAFSLHRQLARDAGLAEPTRLPRPPRALKPRTCVVMCYSLNELGPWPAWVTSAHALVILEPSQMNTARRLMAERQQLLQHGFLPAAPCTHAAPCPLLTHSPRDFCHDRFFFEPPPHLQEIEKFLPMKNRSLTHSYLAMSRTPQALGAARVLGDTLYEKGKIRQAICRGEKREFLSALRKELPRFHGLEHGARVEELPPDAVEKGNELRLKSWP
jgi:hypothetical protein